MTLRKDQADKIIELVKRMAELAKSPYGPKGAGLYSDADNARRKEQRSSLQATKPTIGQQSTTQANKDIQRSKKNPVKIYTQTERNALMRTRFGKAPKPLI